MWWSTIWCCPFWCCTISILHYLMLRYLILNVPLFNIVLVVAAAIVAVSLFNVALLKYCTIRCCIVLMSHCFNFVLSFAALFNVALFHYLTNYRYFSILHYYFSIELFNVTLNESYTFSFWNENKKFNERIKSLPKKNFFADWFLWHLAGIWFSDEMSNFLYFRRTYYYLL